MKATWKERKVLEELSSGWKMVNDDSYTDDLDNVTE